MKTAAEEYNWHLNYGGIALMCRGGCIIRSIFLGKIKEAFENNPGLLNLMLDPYFRKILEKSEDSLRRVVSTAFLHKIPVPALATALTYFDGYKIADLPANMIQAQRDYFGAHTYERKDKPAGEYFHTNWTGQGGNTASSTYNA
jgi:6-phosphogluconate dehydrogenase